MDVISTFTAIDWVVLGVVVVSIVFGALRGLIKTVFGLSAWFLAVVIPLYVFPIVLDGGIAGLGWPMPVWVINILAFFVILVCVQLLGAYLSRLMGKAGLGGTDRVLGALLGGLRGFLILAVLVVVATSFGMNRSEQWSKSHTRPLLDGLGSWVNPFVSQPLSDKKTSAALDVLNVSSTASICFVSQPLES
jgi:membrane protein required for colicin V production